MLVEIVCAILHIATYPLCSSWKVVSNLNDTIVVIAWQATVTPHPTCHCPWWLVPCDDAIYLTTGWTGLLLGEPALDTFLTECRLAFLQDLLISENIIADTTSVIQVGIMCSCIWIRTTLIKKKKQTKK